MSGVMAAIARVFSGETSKTAACQSSVEKLERELAAAAADLESRASDVDAARQALTNAEALYVESGTEKAGAAVTSAKAKLELAQLRHKPIADRHAAIASSLESARRAHADAVVEAEREQAIAENRELASIERAHADVVEPTEQIFRALATLADAVQALHDARARSHAASARLRDLGVLDAPPLDEAHFLAPLLEKFASAGRFEAFGDGCRNALRYALQRGPQSGTLFGDGALLQTIDHIARRPAGGDEIASRRFLSMLGVARTTLDAAELERAFAQDAQSRRDADAAEERAKRTNGGSVKVRGQVHRGESGAADYINVHEDGTTSVSS